MMISWIYELEMRDGAIGIWGDGDLVLRLYSILLSVDYGYD